MFSSAASAEHGVASSAGQDLQSQPFATIEPLPDNYEIEAVCICVVHSPARLKIFLMSVLVIACGLSTVLISFLGVCGPRHLL